MSQNMFARELGSYAYPVGRLPSASTTKPVSSCTAAPVRRARWSRNPLKALVSKTFIPSLTWKQPKSGEVPSAMRVKRRQQLGLVPALGGAKRLVAGLLTCSTPTKWCRSSHPQAFESSTALVPSETSSNNPTSSARPSGPACSVVVLVKGPPPRRTHRVGLFDSKQWPGESLELRLHRRWRRRQVHGKLSPSAHQHGHSLIFSAFAWKLLARERRRHPRLPPCSAAPACQRSCLGRRGY